MIAFDCNLEGQQDGFPAGSHSNVTGDQHLCMLPESLPRTF
jgi:hypothetical protein